MTVSTKIIIGLSLLVVLLIAAGAYIIGKSQLSKKELNAIVSSQEATNKAKDAQIALIATANLKLAEDVKSALADVAVLKKDLKDIKTDNDKLRKQLETAPPESLVVTAQKQLDSTDIRLVGSKVEFGLVPFRTTVIRLSDWENFTFNLIPKYDETIAGRWIESILFYESYGTYGFQPDVFDELTEDDVAGKVQLLSFHKSQVEKTRGHFDMAEAAKATARFRGFQARTSWAEAYKSFRMRRILS